MFTAEELMDVMKVDGINIELYLSSKTYAYGKL